MDVKAVLFDLDGVLIDSHRANRELLYHFADSYGFERPSVQETMEVYTFSLSEGLMKLFNVSEDEAKRMADNDYGGFEKILPLMMIEPNLETFLKRLWRYQLGVVTGRGTTTYDILTHFRLSHYFDVIVERTLYNNPKPDPGSLQLAMGILDVKPAETLYVGDGDVDVRAANAAGMISVYMSDAGHPDAMYNIRKVEELQSMLMSST